MYKKAWCTCKVVVLPILTLFFPFLLPSPSLLPKLPIFVTQKCCYRGNVTSHFSLCQLLVLGFYRTWEIICEWQNQRFVSNKYVSHALYQMLQTTKMNFEKLLGWKVFNNHLQSVSVIFTFVHLCRGRVSSVGWALDCGAGGRGFDSRGQTNTQGQNNWEMKVLPLHGKRLDLSRGSDDHVKRRSRLQ